LERAEALYIKTYADTSTMKHKNVKLVTLRGGH
jgi:hypothetical protein